MRVVVPHHNPDNKVHGANRGPTWALSVPGGPHIGPMNIAIRESMELVFGFTQNDIPLCRIGLDYSSAGYYQ